MATLLSLSGGMAAGKTTTARFIERLMPEVFVDYENPFPVFAEATRRGLRQDTPEGFAETQRLFIANELKRIKQAEERGGATLFDLGPEEIEFYTLRYPMSIGSNWDMESLLAPELSLLRECKPDAVLFLDARDATLATRRLADSERRRGFFDHFIEKMAADKRRWFAAYPNTEFISTDNRTPEEVGRAAVEWVRKYI